MCKEFLMYCTGCHKDYEDPVCLPSLLKPWLCEQCEAK